MEKEDNGMDIAPTNKLTYDGTEVALESDDNKLAYQDEKSQGFTSAVYEVTAPDLQDVGEIDVKEDLNLTREDYLAALDYAKGLTLEDTYAIMREVSTLHKHDPNFDTSIMTRIDRFLTDSSIMAQPEAHGDFIQEMKIEAALITDNSPYAIVRAVVSNTDDPDLPCSTVRAWTIGIIFCGLASFVNQFFSQRQPAISISANVAQLLSFPLAKLWERVMPDWSVNMFGTTIKLNPGHFNQKEHMLITIMANAGFNGPITYQFVFIQYLPKYFDQSWAASYGYNICIGLGNTFLGFALAGVTRRFLVYPAYCVWPSLMQTIALNSSFHSDKNPEVIGPFNTRWRASRMKCFLICFAGMFVYFFFPDYIFTALSMFNWPTWIAPDNLKLAAVMGSQSGVGLNPLPTFDWNYATSFIDPLATPLFSTIMTFAGTLTTALLTLAIYFGNAFNTAYLPMNLNGAFDGYGNSYNVSMVLNDKKQFDPAKYVQYTPPYLSAGFLSGYLFSFAMLPAMVSFAYLYHRHEIWKGLSSMNFKLRFWEKKENHEDEVFLFNDVHNRLMRKYPEVPEWWFVTIGVLASIFSIIGVVHWPTNTSWSVVPFGFAMTLVLTIPSGIITAVTNVEVTYNIAAEFIGGVAYPGDGISMDFFKYFGYYPAAQAISFASDMKLGHYLKVPPRQTFLVQVVGQLVACLVSVGVLLYQFQLPGICEKDQVDKFTCPGVGTTFGSTVLWGVLGPQKIFRGHYKWMLLAFPFGFLIPFPIYFLQKRFPRNSILRSLHCIPFFSGGIYFAPYNVSYYWPAVPFACFSMGYLKSRYISFFSKYNYVVGAAFAVGIALSAIVVFGLNDRDLSLNWWGNTVSYAGIDAVGFVLKPLPDVGYFGPGPGEFGAQDG